MFDRLPAELRAYGQWIVWRLEYREHPGDGLKPTKVLYNARTRFKASVTDPSTWSTYDQALAAGPFAGNDHVFDPSTPAHETGFNGIGFVFTEADPYAVIDLDDTHGDQEAFERQQRIFTEFNSYSEISPSGRGLHILVRGAIPQGRRRSFVEVYSSARFMTMTGNVYHDAPIADRHDLLNILFNEMGGKAATFVAGVDQEQTRSDEDIIAMARNAANGEKFSDLFDGDWAKHYGGDQSRADFALVDILAYYTQNKAQISRLFLMSQLGQRDKARKRPAYVSYMVERSFDRQLPPVDIEGLSAQWAAIMADKSKSAVYPVHEEPTKPEAPPLAIPSDGLYPPGMVGEIAKFIYAAAPRPVPMVALAGALGFFAGIVGRAYNISGTGLNQYVLLIAPTGTGKEAISSGISKLMKAVEQSVPAASEFVGPGDMKSDAGLIKWLSKSPCFVSVVGEFGLRLKQMSSPNAPAHEIGLRRVLLDLFNKSGYGNMLNPLAYSDRDKNTPPIASPAFSMIGESTPERFYGALDEAMISEGLLPRFTILEYNGARPPNSEQSYLVTPPSYLVDFLNTITAHCLTLAHNNQVINVQTDEASAEMFRSFDTYCDAQINAANGEVVRNLWNRAHVKSLKLAALIAVGMYPFNPVVTGDIALWAINTIQAEVRGMLWRFERGEIGEAATVSSNETKQMNEVLRVIREYCTNPYETFARYGGTFEMHRDRIIPFDHINRRLAAVSAFRLDRMGATNAVKRCVNLLVEADDLREIGKKQMTETYGKGAKAYAVFNIYRFEAR